MAGDCIVKVPKYSVYDDYDFIGFSFNGYHCIEDLNILRVNGGSMYSENLTPQIQEKIGQHPGVEGAYLLDIQHKQRVFDVNIAFDSLTDEQLYKLKIVFAGKEMGELWFDEYPYKVWDAKVTGQPMLKVIPFGDEDGPTFYKGEGTIQFTAYYPYAHTPDFVYKDEANQGDGRLLNSYSGFKNVDQWKEVANLYDSIDDTQTLNINGEAPIWIEGDFNYYNESGEYFYFNIPNTNDELKLVIEPKSQFELVDKIQISFYSEKSINTYQSFTKDLYTKPDWVKNITGADVNNLCSLEWEETADGYIYNTENIILSEYYPIKIIINTKRNTIEKTFTSFGGMLMEENNIKHIPIRIIAENGEVFIACDTPKEKIEFPSDKVYSFNSKTGLVFDSNGTTKRAIYHIGKTFGQLKPGKYILNGIKQSNIKYRLWYY